MRVIPFYGLRRSGNHAILEWILHSISDEYDRSVTYNDKKNAVVETKSAAYLNDCGRWKSHVDLIYSTLVLNAKGIKTTIVGYEEAPIGYNLVPYTDKKIIILRDIENLAASRLKSNSSDMLVNEQFVDLWIEYATVFGHERYHCIKFEDWLTSKEHRDCFASELGFENKDKTDFVSEFGSGSSFVGKKRDSNENLLNRSKDFIIPDDTLEMLRIDKVIELRKKLGYI